MTIKENVMNRLEKVLYTEGPHQRRARRHVAQLRTAMSALGKLHCSESFGGN